MTICVSTLKNKIDHNTISCVEGDIICQGAYIITRGQSTEVKSQNIINPLHEGSTNMKIIVLNPTSAYQEGKGSSKGSL